ncbi:BlaI/MecI/CopY family transcriptional regulator [Pseudomarimonas salicorniae]|uniref:BlaI/MecI/CopY family transcriptional regulator n=1 Tax=Pseudomarimonas salicorniae TaxID=2933270 RepID=A0ABT0GCZ1_9GAMM|nr:BlaI/MecI/CopY family transcriptional regulator [Lysobacter sp. CAU 1642]MCK7592396.1 BlaI/MecI/CopY family transcriptional regulator [Lysobacter sp. CAU 1642]
MDENRDIALSDLQLDLMRVLWARGEASTAEVAEALAGSRDLAYTTVATLLSRLEKRGLLSARRDGRQVCYRPRIAEHEVRRSMVSGLLGSLFGGDARALLAHLLREEEIQPGDLTRARALLDADKGGRHD